MGFAIEPHGFPEPPTADFGTPLAPLEQDPMHRPTASAARGTTSRATTSRILLVAGLAVTASMAVAHEDDPKAKGIEPPVVAEPFRLDEGGVAGSPFGTNNMTVMSWLPLAEFSGGASAGNDCWGYTSPSGREYAFIGMSNGTGFAEVTEPGNAQVIGFISGPSSTWRDMKTFNDYLYIVSEGGGGIQVVSLAQIDSGVVTLVGSQTAGGTANSHNVAIDTTSGFLYRCGGGSNGLRIYDLNVNPISPPQVGTWSDKYVHDAQIVTYTSGPFAGRQIAFTFGGYNGGGTQTGVDILDVTNKSAIVPIANVQYPQAAYCHQGWISEDSTTLYALDEQDEINYGLTSRIHIIDISDLEHPVYLGPVTNGNPATTHNCYVRGNRLFMSSYRAGVKVFDITVPTQPSEIAMMDTYPASDAVGYNGCWSVFPLYPSGTVIASDMQSGLVVGRLVPRPAEWAFPQGLPELIDPAGEALEVEIVAGEGFEIDPSTARMLLTRPGTGTVSLPMQSQGGDLFTATFPATECGTPMTYRFTVQAVSGEVSNAPAQGVVSAVAAVDSIVEIDTLEVESGWTAGVASDTATSGIWERVIPVGTVAQPGEDHTMGGVFCFITGQHVEGQNVGFNDVDGGITTLLSPVLSAEGLFEPRIEYARWYSNNAGAAPNEDSMPIDISNDGGVTWVQLELVNESPGVWVDKSFRIADFLTPTDLMRVRFVARDLASGSLVEAGVDDVAIVGLDCGETNPCQGDLNADGIVNGADLGLLLIDWNVKGPSAADLDGNLIVNGADLGLLLVAWGPCN